MWGVTKTVNGHRVSGYVSKHQSKSAAVNQAEKKNKTARKGTSFSYGAILPSSGHFKRSKSKGSTINERYYGLKG